MQGNILTNCGEACHYRGLFLILCILACTCSHDQNKCKQFQHILLYVTMTSKDDQEMCIHPCMFNFEVYRSYSVRKRIDFKTNVSVLTSISFHDIICDCLRQKRDQGSSQVCKLRFFMVDYKYIELKCRKQFIQYYIIKLYLFRKQEK